VIQEVGEQVGNMVNGHSRGTVAEEMERSTNSEGLLPIKYSEKRETDYLMCLILLKKIYS